jgi:hypothetical protein
MIKWEEYLVVNSKGVVCNLPVCVAAPLGQMVPFEGLPHMCKQWMNE